MFNIDLHKINSSTAAIIIYLIINISLCSFNIYTNDKELFLALDISKLILLSMGIISVLMIVSGAIVILSKSKSVYVDNDGYFDAMYYLGHLLLFSMMPLYLDAFNGIFSMVFSTKKSSILFPLIMWFLFTVIISIMLNRRDKKDKEREKSS